MKLFRRLMCLIVVCICAISVSNAQQHKHVKVTGQIVDATTDERLLSASVILLQPTDSVMAAFGISNSDGNYVLRRVKPGNYLLQISYVGYLNISKLVTVPASSDEFILDVIRLEANVELLDQAVITEERVPIRVVKDTIIYNADAFKTQPNDVVEDLLRKMPGIEVESDGTIKAEGEEVEQILVDGKTFFGNDPKIATKNLPARAIKEVQVFDKKSDVAQFTGIDDGIRSKTINLKLKEDYKKGAFGNITGGYGTDERYNGKLNLNSFNKKSKVSVIGQLNNINEQGFSFNEYINFMGGMANLMRSGRVRLSSANTAAPISNGLSNGDIKTGGIGLNLNHEFSKKTKLSASYFYSDVDNTLNEDITRNYFQDINNFQTEETNLIASQTKNHRVNARLDHDIDSMQSLRLTSSISVNDLTYGSLVNAQTNSIDKILQNESSVDNFAKGLSKSYSGSLIYRKKFKKKGRSWVNNLSYSHAPSDQHANLRSINQFYESTPIQIDSTFQDQEEATKTRNFSYSTTMTEPLGGRKYLGLTYTYNRSNNGSKKDVYDLDPELDRIFNVQLSNDYDQLTEYHTGEAALRWVMDKSNLNMKLGLQRSNLIGEIRSASFSDIETHHTHILPSLQWNYDFSRTKSISLNYRTNITQPTLNQLQPIVDNSDPLNLYVGNPRLKPAYRHNVNLRFRNFSQFANTSLFGNITMTITDNAITNSTRIDDRFVRTITPVNIDNNFRLRAWASYSAPLRFIDSRISLSANGSYNDGLTIINDIENKTENLSNTFELRLSNNKKEIIDWSIGAEYSQSKSKYADDSQSDQTYSNQTYFSEVNVPIGTWNFGSTFDLTIYNDNFSESNQTLPIWKAEISKYLFDNKIEVKLSAFDLLDENRGYQQNIELNYIEEVRSNTIGRYFMFSLTYTVGKFKKNAFQITGRRSRRG